jgi:hypothetical protein
MTKNKKIKAGLIADYALRGSRKFDLHQAFAA